MSNNLAALCCLLLAAGPTAADCRAIGEGPVALVELYTSEGCSSCPPADQWLSGLGHAPAPVRVIPLALHVPYWDYIGWQDRFANPAFEARQRRAARLSRNTAGRRAGEKAGPARAGPRRPHTRRP